MAFRIFPEDEQVIELLVHMSRCVTTSVDLLAEHLSATHDHTGSGHDERAARTAADADAHTDRAGPQPRAAVR